MNVSIRSKQLFLIALLSAGACFSAAGYVIVEVRSQGALLELSKAVVSEHAVRAAALALTERTIAETTGDRDRLSQAFLTNSSETLDILNRLEAIGPAMGVTFKNQVIEEVVQKDSPTKEVRMRFVYTGTKFRVIEFTRFLESLDNQSRLTTLSVAADGAVWSGQAEIRFILLTP